MTSERHGDSFTNVIDLSDNRMCAVERSCDSLMAGLSHGGVAERHTSHDDVELEVLDVEAESLDELDDALEDELDDELDEELDLLSVL